MAQGLLASNGILLEDEIQQSSNPAQHAWDIVVKMRNEKLGWCAVNAARGGANEALRLLLHASQGLGYGAHGYWGKDIGPGVLMAMSRTDGAQICLANPESEAEEALWTSDHIAELVRQWPNFHSGCIWQEAAFGKKPDGTYNKEKAMRWWTKGVVSIPEAIMSENPQATIDAMADVNQKLGAPGSWTSFLLFVNKNLHPSTYTPQINTTGGRWSLFRYGDMNTEDEWATVRAWPRPDASTTPIPPIPPPLPGDPMYAELERLVNLFRTSSPNIAKAFDEVEKILKAHDQRDAMLAKGIENLDNTLDAVHDALE